ncbi:MAG: hypothetical protein HYY17_03865 [Planctomycetes bacterium]|nr:hypothetical protein [Planctomycetota bacterium]
MSIEYVIELYWPNKEGRRECRDEYALWSHDGRVGKVMSLPSGSKVLFYETEHDDEGAGGGAKTVFASGTLTDHPPANPRWFTAKGKVWRESRMVRLEHWVPPENGIGLDEMREIMGKSSNWKMRTGLYPIRQQDFERIVTELRKRPGLKSQEAPPSLPQAAFQFRSIAQKEEEESVRDQTDEQVRIRKVHNELMNEFSEFCRADLKIDPEEDVFDALLLMPGLEENLLIEAKSTAAGTQGRHQVRQAIGQLFDYRFSLRQKIKGTIHLAALFPERPEDDILELLESIGIGVIWRYGKTFAATSLVRDAHPRLRRFEKN